MPQSDSLQGSDNLDRLKHELEVEKLAFEKEREISHLKVERDKLAQARKDTRSRLVSSLLVTVIVTGGLSLYGRYYENKRAVELEDSRKAEMTIQLINAREKANNDLRASMFNTLIEFYQNNSNQMSAVLLLELVGLNFKDTVLLKPVFEQLYADESTSEDQRKALRSASRKIVNDQLSAIRQSRDGEVCRLTLAKGQTGSGWCFPPLRITLLESTNDMVRLRTNSNEGNINEGKSTEFGEEFGVNYFDMPMIDYTVSSTGQGDVWRYSIVLVKSSEEETIIAIAKLPQDSYSAQMPFRFDELMSDYISPKAKGN